MRKGTACDSRKLEFFDLSTWGCWTCGAGYNRTVFPIKGGQACERGTGGKFKRATPKRARECGPGQFLDVRNGGECWSCPAGYNRHITPVTANDACIPRSFCDAGLMQYNVHKPAGDDGLRSERYAKCAKRGACGKRGQRPCYVWERLPSCNDGLYEDFEKNTCEKLRAGELPFFAGLNSLSREAGNVKEYCKKALYNIPFWKDAQKWVDAEDNLAVKAMKADVNCRKDFQIGFWCQSADILGVATAPAGIINDITAAGNKPPCNKELSILTAKAAVVKDKKKGVPITAGCPAGAFWDPIDGGSCWRCPNEYKRHITHVKGPDACIKADGFPQLMRGHCAIMQGLWGNVGSSLQCITGLIGSGKFGELKDLFSGGQSRPWNTPCTKAGAFGFETALAVVTGGAASGASASAAAANSIKGLISKLTTKHASLTAMGRVRQIRDALDTMKTISACKPYVADVEAAVASDPEMADATRKPLNPMKASAKWSKISGKASDVGAGAGAVYHVGGGGQAYRWDAARKQWSRIKGLLRRVDVGAGGMAWGIDRSGAILRHDGRKWIKLPGKATDIGVNSRGMAWAIGTRKLGGGFDIYRWQGNTWRKMPGAAVRIDVDPAGNAWAVNDTGNIFRFAANKWHKMPGEATDIAVGANGAVYHIGTDGNVYRLAGNSWNKVAASAVAVSVDDQGRPWVVGASDGALFAWDGAEASQVKPKRKPAQKPSARPAAKSPKKASALTEIGGFTWQAPVGGKPVANAIAGGKFRNKDVSLCHTTSRGQTYVGLVKNRMCFAANPNSRKNFPRYKVLTGDAKRVKWVAPTAPGKAVKGAFAGGELWKPGTPRLGLTVCRAKKGSGLYAGWVDRDVCVINRFSRTDERIKPYEVLVIR